MIKAVIFDLDGTLLYTLEDLWNSTNAALRKFGMPERSLDEVRQFVGNGVGVLIHRAVTVGTTPEKEEACLAYFRSYYKEHMREHTRPYDDILLLLESLHQKGIRTGIVSNKFHGATCALSEEYFGTLIDAAQGEQADVPRKPDPAGLRQILARLGATAEEGLYLGDSPEDAMTAHNAGVEFIAVTWGYRSLEQLKQAGAKQWIDTPMQLLENL